MVSRLLGFYGTQLRVLWEWRGGRVALLKRLVITLVVATISFLLTAWLMPRLTVDRGDRRRDRGHPHGAVQRGRPTGGARPGGARVAHPGRRSSLLVLQVVRVHRRRPVRAGRPRRRAS